MAAFGNSKYTIEQAAKFLKVSEEKVRDLIRQGTLRLQEFNREHFILGGDLDAVKAQLSLPPIINTIDEKSALHQTKMYKNPCKS